MAHSKRRRTEHEKTRNRIVQSKRADKKTTQRLNKKAKWVKNEKYQEEQKKRLEDLKAHPKYQQNIDDGILAKKKAKEQKDKNKKWLAEQRLKRRH